MQKPIRVINRFGRFDELRTFILDFVARMDVEYPKQMGNQQLGLQTRVGCSDRFHSCLWLKEGVEETEYDQLLPELRGTVVEELLASIPTPICRFRVMRMMPKYTYVVHVDPGPRIHVPILSHDECGMLYPTIDYMKRMPANGDVYWMDPRLPHTFANWGNQGRIHLMGSLVDPCYEPS